MLIILIAIILEIILFIVHQKRIIDDALTSDIAEFILVMGILYGIFIPISGYEKSILLEEVKLEAFEEQEVFLKIFGNIYTYRYESPLILCENEKNETKIENKTLIATDVKVVEIESCNNPILQVYIKEAKKSIWTFALFDKKKEYVFYIPKTTIE